MIPGVQKILTDSEILNPAYDFYHHDKRITKGLLY